MAYEKFKQPIRGRVWFDGGQKVPATVRGEWNGWAVAEVAVGDVRRLFRESGYSVRRTARGFTMTFKPDPKIRERVAVGPGDRVYLGDGWSLNWETA